MSAGWARQPGAERDSVLLASWHALLLLFSLRPCRARWTLLEKLASDGFLQAGNTCG